MFFLSSQDVADALGYKTNGSDNLWKDRANVELTSAVLDSYKKAGVTIVDHHTLVSNILFVTSNHQFTKLRIFLTKYLFIFEFDHSTRTT